jgi:UDP-GlcNAc:undecaprenyl-phosphate/decaprenyl-phosphate GlcNAc-1-phosphate transferase
MTSFIIIILISGFVFSLLTNLIILRTFLTKKSSLLKSFKGPQKIHLVPVPRIGSLAIISGLLIQCILLTEFSDIIFTMLLCCMPVFFFGTLEDFTNNISPKIRLMASFISGILVVVLLNIKINTLGIQSLDFIFYFSFTSYIVTILSIAMLAQAINLIDGLNGLSQFTAIMILTSIAYLSFILDDKLLYVSSSIMIAAILGLLVLNFPFGKIFLGDGGAYLIGTYIAILVIMLPIRHEEVSPFVSLLMVIFPIYELVRTVFRRLSSDFRALTYPDSNHLHSILYKHMLSRKKASLLVVNCKSSLLCLMLPLISCLISVSFYNNINVMLISILVYIFTIEMLFIILSKKNYKQNK